MRVILTTLGVLMVGQAEAGISSFIHKENPRLTDKQVRRITVAINQYSTAYGIDPKLVAAIVAVESRFNPKALGRSHGEVGLMQLRPEFHHLTVEDYSERKDALFNIETNIAVGVKYLAGLREVFKARYYGLQWVQHYNSGPSSKPKSFGYAWKVESAYQELGGGNENKARINATHQGEPGCN